MDISTLTLPPVYQTIPDAPHAPPPDKVESWIERDLPRANPVQCLRDIVTTLHHWTRLESTPKILAGLEALLVVSEELFPLLQRDYIGADLPLNDRRLQKVQLVRELWTYLGYGYKRATLHYAGQNKFKQNPPEGLALAIHRAIYCLSQLLVDRYCVYACETPDLWRDINSLCGFADHLGIADLQIPPHSGGEQQPQSIAGITTAAWLLRLADPYHLMPGEIVTLWNGSSQWTQYLEVRPLRRATPPADCLYVDLSQDSGPRFADAETATTPIENGRILCAEKLCTVLRKLADPEADNKVFFGTSRSSTLHDRHQREFYLRLLQALVPRSAGRAARESTNAAVFLISGLEACHHFIGGGRPFRPAQDEESIIRNRNLALDDEFEVLSSDNMEWLDDETLNSVSHTAAFTMDDTSGSDDPWKPTYRKAEPATPTQRSEQTVPADVPCDVRDSSDQGFRLRFRPTNANDKTPHTRAGELVGLRVQESSAEVAKQTWRIGVIRWLQLGEQNDIEMGIHCFALDALAIATKAIEGPGTGSEYFRGIILPKNGLVTKNGTIITAPAVYDIDTVLQVNTGAQLHKIKLLGQLEGTNAFAQFDFRILKI